MKIRKRFSRGLILFFAIAFIGTLNLVSGKPLPQLPKQDTRLPTPPTPGTPAKAGRKPGTLGPDDPGSVGTVGTVGRVGTVPGNPNVPPDPPLPPVAPDPYLEKWIAENPGKPIPGQEDSSDGTDSVSRSPRTPENGQNDSDGGSIGDPNVRSPADGAAALSAGVIAVIIISALAVISSGAFVVHRRRQAKKRHAEIDAPVEDTTARYEVKSETKPLSSIGAAVSLPPPPEDSPSEVLDTDKHTSDGNSSVSPTHSSPILKQDSIVDNELMREDFMSSHVNSQSVETTDMARELDADGQQDIPDEQQEDEEEANEFEPVNTQELAQTPPQEELSNTEEIYENDNVRDSLMITAEEAAVALAGYNQVDDDEYEAEEEVHVRTPSPIDNIIKESTSAQRESSIFSTGKEEESMNSPSYFRDSLVTEISESSELNDSLEDAAPLNEEEEHQETF